MQLWKKSLAALTAGVLCLGRIGVSGSLNMPESVGVLSASAEEGTYGNLSYDVTNAGEIEITGCDMNVASVEIPAEIDGKRVTSIGDNAFRDCTSLTEITIPDSIPQGYTLWNRPRNAMNMVRQVPVMASMIQMVSRTTNP